jgi:hypothetical protein
MAMSATALAGELASVRKMTGSRMLRHGGVQLVVKQLAHTGDSPPVTNSTWIHAPRAPDTNFIDVETVRMNEARGVIAL